MGLASLLGLGQGGLLGGLSNAAPVGQVAVSPLGPPSLNPSVISQLNSSLQNLALTALLGPTLGGQAAGYSGMNMGYPSVEGVSPGLTAAPAGPSQTVASTPAQTAIAEAMANAPSVAQSLAAGLEGDAAAPGATQGLGPAAQTAQGQTNTATQAPSPPSTVSTPVTTAPSSPSSPNSAVGGILQLVMSLLTGYPPLDNLAQNARFG
jgi:hypothetical protein